jgi:metal-responsive CopG/Arc/MetJ family transcriptional regulator
MPPNAVNIAVRIGPDVLAEVDAFAMKIRAARTEQAWTRSDVVRELIRMGLDAAKKKKPAPKSRAARK